MNLLKLYTLPKKCLTFLTYLPNLEDGSLGTAVENLMFVFSVKVTSPLVVCKDAY